MRKFTLKTDIILNTTLKKRCPLRPDGITTEPGDLISMRIFSVVVFFFISSAENMQILRPSNTGNNFLQLVPQQCCAI